MAPIPNGHTSNGDIDMSTRSPTLSSKGKQRLDLEDVAAATITKLSLDGQNGGESSSRVNGINGGGRRKPGVVHGELPRDLGSMGKLT